MYRCTDCGTPAPAGTLFGMALACYECGGPLERVETSPQMITPEMIEPVLVLSSRSASPRTRAA